MRKNYLAVAQRQGELSYELRVTNYELKHTYLIEALPQLHEDDSTRHS